MGMKVSTRESRNEPGNMSQFSTWSISWRGENPPTLYAKTFSVKFVPRLPPARIDAEHETFVKHKSRIPSLAFPAKKLSGRRRAGRGQRCPRGRETLPMMQTMRSRSERNFEVIRAMSTQRTLQPRTLANGASRPQPHAQARRVERPMGELQRP